MSHRHAGRVLVVHVTAACNLRCTYCIQREKWPRVLAWGPLRHALEWVLGSGSGNARIAFTGGEPLLAFPTIARAVEYVDRRRPPDLRVRYEVLTNGLLLGQRALSFLADHDFQVELSFDGVAPAQDLRSRGTFMTLDRLLAQVKHEHRFLFEHQLRIAAAVCRRNIAFLADSVAYFLETGVPTLSITPAMTSDAQWTARDTAELERQFARVYARVLSHYRRTGRVPLELFRKAHPDEPVDDASSTACDIGTGHALAVDVTGRAVPCSLFAQGYQVPGSPLLDAAAERVALGRVSDPRLRERLAACRRRIGAMRLFAARCRKYSSWGRCKDCAYLHRCSVCPVSIGLLPGNTDPDRIPDFQCAFTRTALAYRDRFPCQPPLQAAFLRLERLRQSIAGQFDPAEDRVRAH